MISFIVSLLQAIPILDAWAKKLFALYLEEKSKKYDEDFLQAVDDILRLGDQRNLEKLIGNKKAGLPTDRPEVKTRESKDEK